MKMDLEFLRNHNACESAIKIYTTRQEQDPFKIIELLQNGCDELVDIDKAEQLEWANWLIAHLLNIDDKIRYAIFAAEQVLSLFEEAYPGDDRPRKAIAAAKEYLEDKTARAAARAARAAARADRAADKAADRAAWAAARAASAAARAASAADSAASAADRAASAVRAAANAAWAVSADRAGMLSKIIDYGVSLLRAANE